MNRLLWCLKLGVCGCAVAYFFVKALIYFGFTFSDDQITTAIFIGFAVSFILNFWPPNRNKVM